MQLIILLALGTIYVYMCVIFLFLILCWHIDLATMYLVFPRVGPVSNYRSKHHRCLI
ncbi:hypothetical protein LINPERPRIM_LOCUS8131 [Linum perenne]